MIKGLIENECAGQNALIKLGAHFNSQNVNEQQQKLHQTLPSSGVSQTASAAGPLTSESLINEYLGGSGNGVGVVGGGLMRAAPRSFHMETLFNELKKIDSNNSNTAGGGVVVNKLSPTATIQQQQNASDWSQSYLSSSLSMIQKQSPQLFMMDDRSLHKWSADYLTQSEATIFDDAWENILIKNTPSTNPLASGFALNNDNLIATNQLNEEMRKTANELLDSMQDSRFSETEFLQFVRELSVNALANSNNEKQQQILAAAAAAAAAAKSSSVMEANEAVLETDGSSSDTVDADAKSKTTTAATTNESDEAVSLAAAFDLGESDLAQEWVKEFENNLEEKANLNDYWNDLQSEWNTLASENPNHPWLDEFQKVFDTYKTYEFDAENPLRTHPRAFDEGLERLKSHDIVNAVLLFEAAVQAEPENMLAWQYLGTTQVENEQDAQAIRALRRCLELKPDNLIALSTLATSYTNESMQRMAFDSLINWIRHHPAYSSLLKNDEQAERLLHASELLNKNASSSPFYMATFSVVNAEDFIDLQEIYLKAVRESSMSAPNKIDPDLQCCLGVLFHLTNEYDKAADCFKTALQVKPNDHLLWNKLGATYANNNRNEEAIDAYYQALKLCPGFVRARYNLGIGCMNLGAYKEAVEHFLTALVQQSQACISKRYDNNSPSTDEITSVNNNNTSSGGTHQNSGLSSRPVTSQNVQQMSDTIWSTLRLALSYLNRTDLHAACSIKNLDHLKQEFKID